MPSSIPKSPNAANRRGGLRRASIDNTSILFQVGRFWNDKELDILVEPDGWRKAFRARRTATLRQNPPRSLLVSGEPLVGKSSFLRLLARKHRGGRLERLRGAAAPICRPIKSISANSRAASVRSSTNWPSARQDDLVHSRYRAVGDGRHAIRARARPCSIRSFRRSPPAAWWSGPRRRRRASRG